MSISFLSVFSNVSVCSAHLIILFHPSSDLLTITTSRDRPFSPLVANQTVVHLWRWSILCNFPLHLKRYHIFWVDLHILENDEHRWICHVVNNRVISQFAVSLRGCLAYLLSLGELTGEDTALEDELLPIGVWRRVN